MCPRNCINIEEEPCQLASNLPNPSDLSMANSLNPYAALYSNPNGAGDSRPTALQVAADNGVINKYAGKVIMITGGTAGIGIETTRALYATGADVFIMARDEHKAKRVIKDILSSSSGNGKLEVIKMDMDSLQSVRDAADEFLRRSKWLNILVNNAGK
jgi:hypothetical protein